jgi:hypothetical protein
MKAGFLRISSWLARYCKPIRWSVLASWVIFLALSAVFWGRAMRFAMSLYRWAIAPAAGGRF